MKITSFEEFKELAGRGTFVPVCKEVVADLLTPVSAFLKVAEHADYAFLLESVEGGEHVGRYSFLGKDPFLILRGRDADTWIPPELVVESAQPYSPAEYLLHVTLRRGPEGPRSQDADIADVAWPFAGGLEGVGAVVPDEEKGQTKQQLKDLKVKIAAAMDRHDHAQLKTLRRNAHGLRRKLRRQAKRTTA